PTRPLALGPSFGPAQQIALGHDADQGAPCVDDRQAAKLPFQHQTDGVVDRSIGRNANRIRSHDIGGPHGESPVRLTVSMPLAVASSRPMLDEPEHVAGQPIPGLLSAGLSLPMQPLFVRAIIDVVPGRPPSCQQSCPIMPQPRALRGYTLEGVVMIAKVLGCRMFCEKPSTCAANVQD